MASRNEAAVDTLINTLRTHGKQLRAAHDLDELIERAGSARVVMLGEESHGTSEFYLWRTLISQRLITEKGFIAIAVEGDWPDCYKINRYVKGYEDASDSAHTVLRSFERWPTWMWANREIERLGEWLRRHNATLPSDKRVGFYGLDVYSLWDSIQAVVDYLDKTDPEAANMARQAYRCFEPYGYNEQAYAYASSPLESCEAAVSQVLQDVLTHRRRFDGDLEAAFNAEQNALIAKDAERYYRTMIRADTASWNVRDRHMMDTLHRLLGYFGEGAKIIVWAHNTHVGDARYTDMKDADMFNIGQLAREELGLDTVALVGFSTYTGRVIAGRAWDAPMESMRVPAARTGSWGEALHTARAGDQYLDAVRFRPTPVGQQNLKQRAIGVVYHPQYEAGNYVPTELFLRYDHLVHIERTSPVHPIHTTEVDLGLLPETYPVAV